MVIDSHQHFWNYNASGYGWITDDMSVIRRNFLPSDLEPLLKTHSVAGCVAVQALQTEEENVFLLDLASGHPFIKGVVGWLDLRADDLADKLRQHRQYPSMKGFRHVLQAEPTGFMLDPRFVSGVRALAVHSFTYDLLIYHHQLPEAISFLKRVPDTTVVLDHMAKPEIVRGERDNWSKGIRALAGFENVSCKMSGLVTEGRWKNWSYDDFVPYLDTVLEAFGPRRLMYGSDWPVCLVAASYAEQLSVVERYIAALSPSERSAIMGENAMNFYHL